MRGKNRIRYFLAVRNIARKELAREARISYSQLSRIIRNESSPRFDTMLLIAKALNEDIWDVFYDEQNSERLHKIVKYEEGGISEKGKNKIKKLMKKKGITTMKLSINAGISYSELFRIRNCQSFPIFETMLLIADALGEKVWDVFY